MDYDIKTIPQKCSGIDNSAMIHITAPNYSQICMKKTGKGIIGLKLSTGDFGQNTKILKI